MIKTDQIFKDALHNHETPLSGKASFQGVMQKRKNKRRGFFWFSLSSVLLLLLSLTAATLFRSAVSEGNTTSENNTQINTDNTGNGAGKVAKNAAAKQSGDYRVKNNEAALNQPAFSHTLRAGAISKSAFTVKTGHAQRPDISDKKNNSSLGIKPVNSATSNGSGFELSAKGGSDQILSDNLYETRKLLELSDWIKRLSGRGISIEKNAKIMPTEGTVIPEFVPFYPPREPKFNPIFELNVATAGNGYKYFRESQDVTIAGNHRFSQYQGIMLFDMGRGVNIGAGMGYMESVGIGKALISSYVYDTMLQKDVRITKAQNISYRLNIVSIPLAVRYQLGFGRSLVRISVTAMPGLVTLGSGTMFSRDALQSMDVLKKSSFTMDARLGAGLYYQVAPKTAISAEPMVQYQSIPGAQWNSFSRFGFGFGLGVVFRP